jgi:hypothetical protein
MNLRLLGIAALASVAAAPASATIVTVFGDIGPSVTTFNNTVTAAGGTPQATLLTAANLGAGAPSVDLGDFTITRNNGGNVANNGTYGTLSGNIININPDGTFPLSNGTEASGVTFTFDNPVNAIGFEVGDWGTCCFPSSLFIRFDGGAPILVGISNFSGDVFFGGRAEVFVSALDDSGDFTSVSFWGNGSGEFLVIGGTIRYALIERGSLPTPAGIALFGLGIAALGLRRR